jgi:cyclopropane fatty-acyl-phospholipid synthase-like methyltransferase
VTDYGRYLETLYSERTFERKVAYLEHNFGAFLGEGQTVLEIGPGLGEFCALARRRRLEVDVVDQDEAVLRQVRSKYPTRNAWCAAAESLASLDTTLPSYDRIVMVQVLEHVEVRALGPLVSFLFQHLKAGGMMLATVPNGGTPLGGVERYSDITHRTAFSANSLRQLVHMAGLSARCDVRVEGFRIPPDSAVNVARIVVQKVLHAGLLAIMVANGGVYERLYHPNITLVLTRRDEPGPLR